MQPGTAALHRSARRDHRHDRRGRHRQAVLPPRDHRVLRGPADRVRPDLRRQPGLRGEQLLPGVRRLVPGLLPGGHVVPERARHRAVRRHDGSLPSPCTRGGRRLERVVHQRGHRGLAARAQGRLVGAVHPALLRPGRRATQLRRAEHTAPPLVLRCDADPPAPLAEPHALGPLARQPPHRQPAAGLSDGVAGVVQGSPDVRVLAPAARRHRTAAVGLRLRADAARR